MKDKDIIEIRYNWRQYRQEDHAGQDYDVAKVGETHMGEVVSRITHTAMYFIVLHENGMEARIYNPNVVIYA